MRATASDIALLEDKAVEAAEFLKLLANPHRLLILCRLVVEREMSVGQLGEAVELSQSALSQHLAKLRADGLVATRREAQTVFYRIADKDTARLLALLKDIYCPPDPDSHPTRTPRRRNDEFPDDDFTRARRRVDARRSRSGRRARG